MIFKHGITEEEAASLPVLLREYQPAETDTKIKWSIPIDENEHYAIVFNKGELDSSSRLGRPGEIDTQEPITVSAPLSATSDTNIAETPGNVNDKDEASSGPGGNYLVTMYREATTPATSLSVRRDDFALSAPTATGTDGYSFNQAGELVGQDGRVLFQRENIPQVQTNAFKDILGNMKKLRDKAIEIFDAKFRGRSFTIESDGRDVRFQSRRKLRADLNTDKFAAVDVLDKMVNNALFSHSEQDDGRHPYVKMWHYYNSPISIDGAFKNVEFAIE
jgi:hypothetical protein